MNFLKRVADLGIHFFFPVKCHFCLRDQASDYKEPLCMDCLKRLKTVNVPYCLFCGRSLDRGGDFCRSCAHYRTAGHFEFSRSVYMFNPEIRELIHDFKYRGFKKLGIWLGERMAERFSSYIEFSNYDMLIPLPLSASRMKERGYNQSLILATEIARTSGLELNHTALVKNRKTAAQASLGKKEREKNVKGAFSVLYSEKIKDRKIILIDDVATTMSTLNEAALALKKAGASRVSCYTLARE